MALVQLRDRAVSAPREWQVILREEGKVVLYDARHNQLSVRMREEWSDRAEIGMTEEALEEEEEDLELIQSEAGEDESGSGSGLGSPFELCPLCRQSVPRVAQSRSENAHSHSAHRHELPPNQRRLSYFALLSEANSRATTPRATRTSTPVNSTPTSLPHERSGNARGDARGDGLGGQMLNGYFATYFTLLQKLGQGANGEVHLARHCINGEGLGLYACKRIAVGDSSPNLLRILREVHLLESLQHPNVITYHHAWVEQSQASAFSPPVPTLFVLMQYANGGSLQAFVSQRRGGATEEEIASPGLSAAERIRLFRSRKLSAVHLLRLDEILTLFEDINRGLGFLHDKGILHLDLKAENVLLHWEEDALLPTAKLSDFGSADFTSDAWQRERTGGSGTVDWLPPESWSVDSNDKPHCPDRATDQWALGLILFYLCFFTLPYKNHQDNRDLEALATEIRDYPGFFPADAQRLDHGTRHDLPQDVLSLIARLVHRNPGRRPSSQVVASLIARIRTEAIRKASDGERDVRTLDMDACLASIDELVRAEAESKEELENRKEGVKIVRPVVVEEPTTEETPEEEEAAHEEADSIVELARELEALNKAIETIDRDRKKKAKEDLRALEVDLDMIEGELIQLEREESHYFPHGHMDESLDPHQYPLPHQPPTPPPITTTTGGFSGFKWRNQRGGKFRRGGEDLPADFVPAAFQSDGDGESPVGDTSSFRSQTQQFAEEHRASWTPPAKSVSTVRRRSGSLNSSAVPTRLGGWGKISSLAET